jgi:hypothetical protein
MIKLHTRTNVRVTYEEALMYCFCIGEGWRLPTKKEIDDCVDAVLFMGCWYKDRPYYGVDRWLILPVRDINDD